jgi:crotonobetainyl-CoA:carnitine CoA-transferase CaiB-like acyl-CoA transferase
VTERRPRSAPGPLVGIRVLDLTDQSAVFGTRLLADLGGDVVRVEPPGGDGVRRLAPFLGGSPGAERSLWHLYHNAGKQSVVVDRATPAGRADFWALVADADVIVETERLDPAEVTASNPSVVHVTVSPFGLDGPRAQWRATDLISVAAGGLAFVCGDPAGPPVQPGADQAHKLAGLAAAAAVAIALAGRDRGPGRPGVHIDLSAQDAVATTVLQTANPSRWAWQGQVPGRPGLGQVYQCADGGWVTLTVRPNRRERFARWAEQTGALSAADLRPLLDPSLDPASAGPIIAAVVAAVSRREVMAAVRELDLMGLPVSTLDDLRTWDHLDAIAEFVDVPQETAGSTLRFPRSPVGQLAAAPTRRAPVLGEHTAEVLAAARRSPAAQPTGGRLDMSTALAGIRVVDFCWMIAGPLGTRLLADFGAEVIRVEAGPRAYPDVFPPGADDPSLGAFHNTLNTQKRSVTIDPRTPRGRELLLDLVATADVVTNNYRPPAFENLGFTDDVLRERNPRLINLHMPGTGRAGPWSRIGTFGTMIAAAAGLNCLTGFPGTPPRGLGVAYADFSTPFLVPLMVLSALRERDRTGAGMVLELNQLAATISLLGVEWMELDSSGVAPPMRANRDPNCCPHGIYPARGDDEWVAIAVTDDQEFAALSQAIGCPDLASRLPTAEARAGAEAELDALLSRWARLRDKWQAASELQALGVPSAPVQNLRDAMEIDDRLSVRHYITVEQPSHPGLKVPIQNTPIQTAGEPRTVGRAPMYGEDNDYVLRDILGRSAADVLELRQAGVIR